MEKLRFCLLWYCCVHRVYRRGGRDSSAFQLAPACRETWRWGKVGIYSEGVGGYNRPVWVGEIPAFAFGAYLR